MIRLLKTQDRLSNLIISPRNSYETNRQPTHIAAPTWVELSRTKAQGTASTGGFDETNLWGAKRFSAAGSLFSWPDSAAAICNMLYATSQITPLALRKGSIQYRADFSGCSALLPVSRSQWLDICCDGYFQAALLRGSDELSWAFAQCKPRGALPSSSGGFKPKLNRVNAHTGASATLSSRPQTTPPAPSHTP